MIEYIGKILGKFGKFEIKYFYLAVAIVLLFSIFSAIGLTKITFQSDFDAMNPQNLEVIKLNDEIQQKFGQGEATVILIELETNSNLDNQITDIRDPKVIEFVKRLEQNLKQDSRIESVASPGMFFQNVPETLDESKKTLSAISGSENFFSSDYSFTLVNVFSNAGFDEKKIRELSDSIKKTISESGVPGGIKTTVTGTPPLLAVMFNFLIRDSFMTLIYAAILIFFLIFFLTRAIKKSIIIMIPLLFGLLWTAGILGWSGTPITIATAGISAMLLGLGVEYSIFLFSRYEEERKEGLKMEKAIVKALSTTGAATMSSGLTTVIGFGVLTLSVFPILSDMGFSLAIGIGFAILSTMTILPLAIITNFKISGPIIKKKNEESKILNAIFLSFSKYGKFVANKPGTIILIALGITALMFVALQNINNNDIDFDTVLPQGIPELEAYNTITNDLGSDTTSVNIFVEINPSEISSNEPLDIRDPAILNYIDILSQKSKEISYAQSVSSISSFYKQINNQKIPSSLREAKNLVENKDISSYVTQDYSGTIIRITIGLEETASATSHNEEIVRQVKEIIETTQKPVGIKTVATGGIIVSYELDKILNPDTARTSIFALIGIIILLLVLSRSFKYTFLPLLTVIFAIFWTLGLLGIFQIPFNSITSSVLTMTIGIGIDFGLQLSMRFRQELETKNKRKAMQETLKNVLYPMSITVIAAVIGFQTMRLGNLTLMADLGMSMSFSIISSMLVAITLVAGLIVVFERKSKSGKI